MIASRPVNARTNLSIPIQASVPELVNLTNSTDGTASITALANTFSKAPGAPKEVPMIKQTVT